MKSLLLSIVLFLFAGFASAQETNYDFSNMNAAQSAEFGSAVRAYLLTNPEVIMEAVAILEQRQAAQANQNDINLVQQYAEELFYDGFSHVAGNPDGEILIVEFMDYKCAFCKRAHPEVMALLAANPDIRLVIKEYPILGAESVLSSRAAVALLVNDGDAVYSNFNDLTMRFDGPLNEATLRRLALDSGGDADAMMDMIDSTLVTQIIQTNRLLGQRMAITGTPTFVFGDQMLRGYVPLAQMQLLVDDVRASLN